MKSRWLLSCLMVALAMATQARADETYPARQVRIVVPYSSGGSPDTVARLVAKGLTTALGQSFYVDDKPGANGIIASDIVASSAPDGYTLLLASDGPIVIMPLLDRGVDPLERLIPVNLIGESAFVLVARPDLGVTDLKGVIALAKKQRLTFGSAGVGSQHHLAGELLKVRAGIDLVHVPYKGFGEEAADVMSGRIDLAFGGVPPALPFINSKKVLPIAVTSEIRNGKLPSVPTFEEQGVPNYRVLFWVGIMAPKGTPQAIIDKLNDATTTIDKSPDILAGFDRLSIDPINAGPAGFAQRLQKDKTMWGELIAQIGLKIQQ
jgi:tripartite-type tricarboxylate transporter receptor subunit TctC